MPLTDQQQQQLTDLANQAAEAVKNLEAAAKDAGATAGDTTEAAEKAQEAEKALKEAQDLAKEIDRLKHQDDFDPDAYGKVAERLITVVSDHLPISPVLKKLIEALAKLWGDLVASTMGSTLGAVDQMIHPDQISEEDYDQAVDDWAKADPSRAALARYLKKRYQLRKKGLLPKPSGHWYTDSGPELKERLKKELEDAAKKWEEWKRKHLRKKTKRAPHDPHGAVLLLSAAEQGQVELAIHSGHPAAPVLPFPRDGEGEDRVQPQPQPQPQPQAPAADAPAPAPAPTGLGGLGYRNGPPQLGERPRRGRKWAATAAKVVGVLGALAAAGGLAYGLLHHNGESAFAAHYPAADHQVQQVEGNLLGSLAGSGSRHELTPSTVDAAASQVAAADRTVGAVPVPTELTGSVAQLRSGLARQHQELSQLSAALKKHQVGVANRNHVALLGQALNVSASANETAAAAGLPPAKGPATSPVPAASQTGNASASNPGAPATSSPAEGGIAASASQTEALPPASAGSTAGDQFLGVKVQLANETTASRLVLPASIPSLATSTGRAAQPALSYTGPACSASTSAALTGVVLNPGEKLTTCVPFQLSAGEQPQRFGYQLESIAAAEPALQSAESGGKGVPTSAPAGAGG